MGLHRVLKYPEARVAARSPAYAEFGNFLQLIVCVKNSGLLGTCDFGDRRFRGHMSIRPVPAQVDATTNETFVATSADAAEPTVGCTMAM
jgi:hypothetical protein